MSIEGERVYQQDIEDGGFVTIGAAAERLVAAMRQARDAQRAADPVNNPAHYTAHPSGVECIQIVEHMSFPLGCVVKYVWRADLKGDALEDLRKARFYLDREIARREAALSEGEA